MALEKIERRGKYAGVKAHLSGPECQRLLDWREKYKKAREKGQLLDFPVESITKDALDFCKDLSKHINNLLAEDPNLLKDREPEQVQEALLKDQAKISEQLATIKK